MSCEVLNLSEKESGKIPGVKPVEEHGAAEAGIQYCLETYKNYIVQCIDYKDLLFYKHFCPKKRREFREKAKLQDSETLTCEMIDCIISMTNISDRFTALVNLFQEEIENEKVLRILKGEKIPCNSSHNKENIQKQCMKEICENLQVGEIIPHLLRHELILPREGDHLRNKARQETCFDAAIDLLLLLPSRHPNWYPRFLCCLIDSGHQTLAEMVDKDLCEKIISRTKPSSLDNNNHPKPYLKEEIIADELEDMSLVSGPIRNCKSYSELLNHETFELSYSTEQRHVHTVQDGLIEQEPEPANAMKRKDCVSKFENTEQTNDMDSASRSPVRSRKKESILRWLLETETFKWMQKPEGPESQVDDSIGGTCGGSTEWSSRASDFTNMGNSSLVIDDNVSSSCTLYEGSIKSNNLRIGEDAAFSVADKNEGFCVYDDTSQKVFTEDEVTRYRNIQRESQKKELQYPALELLFMKTNLHPVKMSLILKQHPELLNTSQILVHVSRRSMQFRDDTFALRAHYILTVIQEARHAESLDEWIDKLLTGRAIDGYYEFQDILIRQVVEEFPYKKSQLFKQLQWQIRESPEGDGLTSLKLLIQGLNGNQLSTDVEITCRVCEQGYKDSSRKLSLKEISNKAEKDLCDCSNGDASLESMSGIVMDHMYPDDPVYKSIEENLQKTGNKECRHCRVTDIKKIRNTDLYEMYLKMTKKNSGKVNERYLFHWSKSLRRVIEKGYFGVSTEQILQEGVYFADDPLLYVMDGSWDYRLRASVPCGCHRMLLCRVNLGNSLRDSCSMQLTKIPKGHHFIKMWQRINETNYTKYILLNGEQVYPEYLVTFKTIDIETVRRGKQQGAFRKPKQTIRAVLV